MKQPFLGHLVSYINLFQEATNGGSIDRWAGSSSKSTLDENSDTSLTSESSKTNS